MIRERQSGLLVLHTFLQGTAVAVSFTLWIFFWQKVVGLRLAGDTIDYTMYVLVIVISLVIVSLLSRRYERDIVGGSVDRRLRYSLRQVVWIISVIGFFLVSIKDVTISRAFLFTYLPILFVVLSLTNLLLPNWLMGVIFKGGGVEPCLLVSLPDSETTWLKSKKIDEFEQREFVQWLDKQTKLGVEILGIVGDDERLPDNGAVKKLGEPDKLGEVLDTLKVRSLLLLNFPREGGLFTDILNLCEERGIHLSMLHNLQLHFGRPVIMRDFDGMNLLQFRSEPLQNPMNRAVKRVFDVFLSGFVVLFLLPPVALLVWLMQRIQAPGPLFFRQERSGKGNEAFQILKFRSMYDEHHEEAKQASAGDTRIYPFGSFIRKTSLDELPQFFNVLVGEMSVVGPRPHLAIHNMHWEKFMRPYRLRSRVKPGITGLAQIRGLRGEVKRDIDIRERIECDLEYLEKWSFFLDLSVVAATAIEVLTPKKSAV